MGSVLISEKGLSKEIATLSFKMQKEGRRSLYYCTDFMREAKVYETPLRSQGTIDTEKIMNVPFYSRYQDKTQVYSLYKNDDITRRGLHVQFVSRIARDIGSALGLNNDLIEAISLGHDLGHTPFGHLGEGILDSILNEHIGLHFLHNVQSVRVLRTIFPIGVSLETLIGILCHNGELEVQGISPTKDDAKNGISSFERLDEVIDMSMRKGVDFVKHLLPSTHEAAVVRFSDIFAYLGKDRYDAMKILKDKLKLDKNKTITNSEIIRYFTEDLVEHSFAQPYITLSEEAFDILKTLKRENYSNIYESSDIKEQFGDKNKGPLRDAFLLLFEMFLSDLKEETTTSPIYKHHINYLLKLQKTNKRDEYLENYFGKKDDEALSLIVIDYLQSMTDDYFCSLSSCLCPSCKFEYVGYFKDMSLEKYKRSKDEHC